MLFVLGLLMTFAGVAMVVQGRFTLLGGRVVASKPSRRAGIAWLSFFPVVFLVRFLVDLSGLDEYLDPRLILWLVGSCCLIVGLAYLWPALSGPAPVRPIKQSATLKPVRPAVPAQKEPTAPVIADVPPPAPEREFWLPSSGEGFPHGSAEKNPFDFS